MRIHAREQDIQRKVNVALARAKRAEGLVSALRHENSSLRAKLKMLEGVGHGSVLQRPDLTVDNFIEFHSTLGLS